MTRRVYRNLLPFITFFSFQLFTINAQTPDVALDGDHVAQEIKPIVAPVQQTTTFPHTARTAALQVSTTIQNAHCFGSSDGSIEYIISGGTPPYTFQWNSGTNGKVFGSCWNILEINNPGATTLTDYQVMVTLPFVSGMNNDFSDVLFSDTNNTIAYSFWRESYQSGTSADFWVKMPSFPPGISYIRASYCDPSATTKSDGVATFEYFDNFDDQDISDWTHTCGFVDYPDEVCEASTVQVSGTDYAARVNSYAHCLNTPPVTGVTNSIKKNVTLPAGQYWLDVSSKFMVCLRTICSDSARIFSRFYINSAFYSAFFLEKNTTCGCVQSGWTQIRANSFVTSTGIPIEYDLRTEVTDCGEGELLYDNFRLRKWYVNPSVVVDSPQRQKLDSLPAGTYTINVTDAVGSTFSQSFQVGQPAPPASSNVDICKQTPASLSVSGSYTDFYWYALSSGGARLQTGTTLITDSLNKDTLFYVAGVGSNACESNPRTTVKVHTVLPDLHNGCLTIYEGISPNGDGLNEYWSIEGIKQYPENRIRLYDRWGNLVYEKEHYGSTSDAYWRGQSNNGLSKGQDLPDGTYYYEIEIQGLEKPLSGYVILNRKH